MGTDTLGAQARRLVSELNEVRTKYKPFTTEREQAEDKLYAQLKALSDEALHSNHPQKHEIVMLVTGHEHPRVTRLPIYTDQFRMFTKHPSDPKVSTFLAKMVREMEALPDPEVQARLQAVERDGPRDILKSMISHPQREAYLKSRAKQTCTHCWKEVLPRLFDMTAELLVLEMRQRSIQVYQMVRQGHLTLEDGKDLAAYMDGILDQLTELMRQKPRTKDQWSQRIEHVFRLMVKMINEIMSRYVRLIRAE